MKTIYTRFLGLLLIIFLMMPGVAVYAEGELSLECSVPFSIFEGNQQVKFAVNSVSEANITATDYWGNTVFSEAVGNGEFSIPDLKNGWYKILAQNGAESVSSTFSVVPKLSSRRDSSKSAVAFSAMASHTYSSNNQEADYAKSIVLAGVPFVREFCNYEEVWDTDITGGIRAAKLLNEYEKNGIDVMYMFQHMPGENGTTDGHYITDDLLHVYETVQEICRQHGDKIDVLEVLNEVDINHYKDAPERYAAVLKAASIALDDYEGDVRIGNSGFWGSRAYIEKFLQNEVEKYIDVYNTHFYVDYNENENVCVYPETLDELSYEAENYALVSRDMWLSEYGLRIPYEEELLSGQYPDLTEEQQLKQARTAPAAIVKAQAAGVDKVFWFIHGYINENGNSFGTMNSSNTPHMIYSSIAALTNALGNAKYCGTFNSIPDGVYGYCFRNGKEEVGCFWSEENTSLTLNVNGNDVVVSDIMGNETAAEINDGQLALTVGSDIVYVRAAEGFAAECIDEAEVFEKVIQHPAISKSERVVLLPVFDDETTDKASVDGYKLSATEANVVKLRAYNFNSEEMSGKITATPSGGWTVGTSACEVTIPAMDYAEVEFTVNCNDGVARRTEVPLVFSGEFDEGKTSDAVCHIMTTDSIYINPDSTISKYFWTKSTAYDNNGSAVSVSTDGAAVKMNCNFEGIDFDSRAVGCTAWYSPDFSERDGFVVEYKADKELSTLVRLWISDKDGDLFYSHTPWNLESTTSQSINLTGEWQQVVYPWNIMNDANTAGDGVLDLTDCEITIGIKPQSDADVSFNVYFQNAGFYAREMAEVPEVSCTGLVYAESSLKSTYNNSGVKAARHIIDGKVYDVTLAGANGTLNIVLPDGSFDVATICFDMSNKATLTKNSIDVVHSDGEYTVMYDANGGKGAPEGQLKIAGQSIKLSKQVPYAEDAVFAGWSTDRDAATPQYYPGDIYSADESAVLYAIWSEGTKPDYKTAAQYTPERHAIVKGFAGIEYAGKRAAVFVYNSSADLENFGSEDLIYVNELQVGADGNYVFEFMMDEASAGYSYILSVDGKLVKGELECVEYCYKWYDTSINITNPGDRLLITAVLENHTKAEASCVLAVAAYDNEGRLIDVEYGEVDEKNLKQAYIAPENSKVVKAFLWSDFNDIVPLNLPAVKTVN